MIGGRRTLLLVAIATFAAAVPARADIVNGGFEAGLSGWSSTGTVSTVPIPQLGTTVASISRAGMLWQTFALNPGAQTYSFRYAVIHVPNPGDTGPPLPDALNIFLLNGDTLENLVPAAPGFEGVSAFMLVQQSGIAAVNPVFVSVIEPDFANSVLGTVIVNLAALPQPLPSSIRIEFGVLNGDDDSRLDALIDDVTITVPAPEGAAVVLLAFAGARRRR